MKITPTEKFKIIFEVSVDDIDTISKQKLSLCTQIEDTFSTGSEPQLICDVSRFRVQLLNDSGITSSHEWVIVNQIGSKDPIQCVI